MMLIFVMKEQFSQSYLKHVLLLQFQWFTNHSLDLDIDERALMYSVSLTLFLTD